MTRRRSGRSTPRTSRSRRAASGWGRRVRRSRRYTIEIGTRVPSAAVAHARRLSYRSGSYPGTGWRFTSVGDPRRGVVVVRRRRCHQRRVLVAHRRRVVLGVATEPRRVDLVGHRHHVVVGDRRRRRRARARGAARRPRRVRTPPGSRRTRRRRRGGCRSRWGRTVVHDARPGLADRGHHQREVLGTVGVAEHVEPVTGRAGVVLDVVLVILHAWLRRRWPARSARRRRPATPRSSPSTTTRSRRTVRCGCGRRRRRSGRRPPGTRGRRRWRACRAVWRQICHGRMASSGRV